MSIFYSNNIKDDIIELSSYESNHCIRVLRKKKNDRIEILDGDGRQFACKIINENSKKVFAKVISKKKYINDNTIHIAVAPTKSHEKVDLIIEKMIEIGVAKISFINTKRTIRSKININRINRISISAMKQSGRFFIPQINNLVSFKEFVENVKEKYRFIAHLEKEENRFHLATKYKKGNDCCILIGPEGDFTKTEIDKAKDNKFLSVSLGRSTLRTETAAIFSISTINIINDQ